MECHATEALDVGKSLVALPVAECLAAHKARACELGLAHAGGLSMFADARADIHTFLRPGYAIDGVEHLD